MARQPSYQLKEHATGQWYIHWQGGKRYFGTNRAEAEKRKAQWLAEQEGDPYRSYREFLEQSKAEGAERRGKVEAAIQIVERAAEAGQPTPDGGKPLAFALELWNHYAEVRGRSTRTKGEKERYYGLFQKWMRKHFAGVTLLGLRREHFKGFRDYSLAKWGKKHPLKCNRALQLTGEVLRRAFREEPNHFPDGLLAGLELIRERAPYSPSPFNEEPYPADEFRALVAACDEIGSEGLRDKALLHCMANFGLDCSDVESLQWQHFVLDASTPRFDMTRAKMRGRPNERYTRRIIPIAPTTLKHLEAFRKACGKQVKPDGFVFVGLKRGNPLTRSGLGGANGFLRRLKRLAGFKSSRYSPKHLRNVGSNIAREAGLGLDVIDYFLGHTIDSEARKYLSAEASARLAVPLVDLLESRYFNGHTKGKPKKSAVQ